MSELYVRRAACCLTFVVLAWCVEVRAGGGAVLGPQGTVSPTLFREIEFKADGLAIVSVWAVSARGAPFDIVVYDSRNNVVARARIRTKAASYSLGGIAWRPSRQEVYRVETPGELSLFTTN